MPSIIKELAQKLGELSFLLIRNSTEILKGACTLKRSLARNLATMHYKGDGGSAQRFQAPKHGHVLDDISSSA